MLVCKACGALLVSDGEYWQCPHRRNREIHPTNWTELEDMRLNSVRERERDS